MRSLRAASAVEQLPPNDKLTAAGEAIRRLGEIDADRSAMQFCEIEYLFRPEQEPIMSLDAFDRQNFQNFLVSTLETLSYILLLSLDQGNNHSGFLYN